MAEAALQLEPIEVIKKKQGKRFSTAVQKLRDKGLAAQSYAEAIQRILDLPKAKFDETLEIALRLGVDPKQSDQNVRGAVALPHGSGKSARILVFAKGAKLKEAEEAGADFVGAEELVEKINAGWLEFDSVVATPDMMAVVSKVARVLGPKGLMPNPKVGTVTMDLKNVITDLKKGRVEFRIDKAGIVHAGFGKISMGKEKLIDNFKALTEQIVRAKPSSVKGAYILSAYISSSMSPSVMVDVASFYQP
jgi:large subunit ribosomal protein L1